MANTQIIDMKKHGDSGGCLEYGFYLWRENSECPWQMARILEEGWLEVFDDDHCGGSETTTWYGELLGPTPLKLSELAKLLGDSEEGKTGQSKLTKEDRLIKTMASFFKARQEERCARINGHMPPKQARCMSSIIKQAVALNNSQE